jgi:hypothetical protein
MRYLQNIVRFLQAPFGVSRQERLAAVTANSRLLDKYARSNRPSVVMALLDNPHLKARHVTAAARLDNVHTQGKAARHPKASKKLVQRLAAHPNVLVRGRIAERKDLAVALQETLANDPTISVRSRVMANPHIDDQWRSMAALLNGMR